MHHPSLPASGTRPVMIEVFGEPVGVVVPAESGYRFMAVRLEAFGVDGEHYASLEAARAGVSAAVAEANTAAA
ncbi:hypothetical protein EMQ25_13540 [Arsenicitalea aurantiaca]|uniref:Uncharacterized protein n=1 Tax=Arsenicitalea aurantiaca TaxID=1783274 RepID=A0A433X8G0_9HYPH|nr:hypothetical protein [Arsenicitalea aurantiaca]RUT30328.1 hypothetical protein EMQ25_13540 [Arsenicitalea aurantiaca]